jgi:GNAT superfamily N-acetyltransferase
MTKFDRDIRIRPLARADIAPLVQLAREIWFAHYPGIISRAQIEYMLDERYAPAALQAELQSTTIWWDLALWEDRPVAFSSYLLTERAHEMKLDKLYVHPHWQRHGLGRRLIDRASERARALGCSRLVLAVNKRNEHAIAAYRKHGFVVESAVVKDIGQGFVMDDYIMLREL